MNDEVYIFRLNLDWNLLKTVSKIDRFDASWSNIESNPGCKSGEVAKKLHIPNPTVKRILTKLLNENLIEKYGIGAGTNYSIK